LTNALKNSAHSAFSGTRRDFARLAVPDREMILAHMRDGEG